MKNILRVEFFRLKKSTTFWLCLALCVVLPVVSLFFTLLLDMVEKAIESGVYYIDALRTQGGALATLCSFGSVASDFNLLALICSAVVLCGEFSQGTIRNMIFAGKKRSEIFWAMYVVALTVGVINMTATFCVTLLLDGIVLGLGNLDASTVFTNLVCFYVLGLSSTACVQTMVCMFVFGSKKTVSAVLFPILICRIVPGLATTTLTIVRTFTAISEQTLYFVPFYNSEIVNPIAPSMINMGMVLIYNVVLSAAFWAIGYFPFKKSDLR